LLTLVIAVDVAQKSLEVALVFGGGFVLRLFESCITDEYFALLAPVSGLGRLLVVQDWRGIREWTHC
jgi:hypothetical protein